MNTFIFILIFFVLTPKFFFTHESQSINCENNNSCRECILSKGCAWCSKVKPEIFKATSRISKCHSSKTILEICKKENIENPQTFLKIITNEAMKNELEENPIRIRPQEIFLKLKPEEEFTIDIEFKEPKNYPIDLYYLMDFSSSMSKHKKNLSKLGNKLAEVMKNLTNNFQLGFGSFVDKVILPFTSTKALHIFQPCIKCRSPYSFKNHMPLSQKTTRFSVEVEKAQMSGNIDTPEGVFDALMQVVACHKKLNWREKARHIIVVSTDAPFHLAGDGKLGGLVEPHSGLCFIYEDYSHSLASDYPSVSQINHRALDNNINIIFAVVKKVKKEYLSLSKEIRGAALGLLDAGENIADLIKAQYEKITTAIRLTDNAREPVRIAFSARCNENEKWKNSSYCIGVKGNYAINFKIHISFSDCSFKMSKNQEIKIKPIGINETLKIHLESICDCECSKVNYFGNEMNSKYCSFSGYLICGKCVCHKGKIGEKCECNGNNEEIPKITDTKSCIRHNTTEEICSGRGDCKCGVCQCYPRKNFLEEVNGKFCECDNFSCEKFNGLLCSGHGTCKCGKCLCDSGWTGQLCGCPVDKHLCMAENEENFCSGRGSCICGVCHCHNVTMVDEHRYAGKYCQICMTCQQECDLLNDCVECLSYNSGPQTKSQCKNCIKIFQHNVIENLQDIEKNISGSLCVSADHSGCIFKYYYYYNEIGQLIIWAEANTLCRKQINLYVIMMGIIGCTILIGVLSMIICKILIDIHDKREYEIFEKERHLARWGRGENPLFKTATTTYENPTYSMNSY